MGFDRARVKANAQKHYQLNKWNNVLVVLITTAIAGVGGGSSGYGSNLSGLDSEVAIIIGIIMLIASLIGIALSIFLTSVVNLGSMGWFRKSIHTEKLPIGEMFAPFKKNYMDNVLTMFLKNLYITLWTLLFIIPGIVKGYSYSMVEYIKSENPDIPAARCIEISKAMTDGHKGDLFLLDLSFVGWNLLSALTLGILTILYVGPYYNAAKAFAYEELKASAIASGKVNAGELNPPVPPAEM